jgi:hypothetical protein
MNNWTDELLDKKRLLGDPLADEAVAAIVAEKGPAEAGRLFNLLITNIDLPLDDLSAPIRNYLTATNQLSADTDWEQIRLATDLFIDHGPKFLLFLYYKSLPLLYLNARGAVVLEKTSRLMHEGGDVSIFTRRVAETGQFLLDVMAPGHLQAGGKGIRAIQKVRLIHASIRHFMPTDQWDAAALGVPINQEDLAQTLMTFGVTPVDALAQFGLAEPDERLWAYVYTWNRIGELLGIDGDLLPANLDEARRLLQIILDRQAEASSAGNALTNALIQFAKNVLPADFERAPELLMTHLIGGTYAGKLGVNINGGCLGVLLPEFIITFFRLGERLEDKLDGPLNTVVQHLAQRTTQAMINYFDKYKGRHFTIPQTLQKAWHIEAAQ